MSQHFKRGNFQAAVTVDRNAGVAKAIINEPLLKELAAIAARLREDYGLAASTPEGLMALAGSWRRRRRPPIRKISTR